MFVIGPIQNLPLWVQQAAIDTAMVAGIGKPRFAAILRVYDAPVSIVGPVALRDRTLEVEAMLRGLTNDLEAFVACSEGLGVDYQKSFRQYGCQMVGAQFTQRFKILAVA